MNVAEFAEFRETRKHATLNFCKPRFCRYQSAVVLKTAAALRMVSSGHDNAIVMVKNPETLFSNPLPGERVAACLRVSHRQEGRMRGRDFHAVASENTRTSPHPPECPLTPSPSPQGEGSFQTVS